MQDPDADAASLHRDLPPGRRPAVAALALIALLLPSCITASMWDGEWQLRNTSFAAEHARVLAADAEAPLRLLVAVDPTAATAIGTTATTGPIWIELRPDDQTAVAALLQQIGQDAHGLEFEVRFWPPQDDERRADVRLRTTIGNELERTGITDTRPSRQARRRLAADSPCSWRALTGPPPTAASIPMPTVTVMQYERVGLSTAKMVLFTPLTVVCDAVLLPLELLLVVALALAD